MYTLAIKPLILLLLLSKFISNIQLQQLIILSQYYSLLHTYIATSDKHNVQIIKLLVWSVQYIAILYALLSSLLYICVTAKDVHSKANNIVH